MGSLRLVHAVIGRYGDASWTPCAVASACACRTNDTLLLTGQRGIIFIIVMVCVSSLPKDLADQPTSADIFPIHNTAVSQLDALSCPVHPGEVEVEEGLNDTKGKADGEDVTVAGFRGTANDPVENIEGAIRAKSREVEAIDNGRDRCLAEEKQLRKDAERFEDERKCIGNLIHLSAQIDSAYVPACHKPRTNILLRRVSFP